MKHFATILAALMVAASSALAAEPVKVTADTFTIDQSSRDATFTGNVVITRGTLTIWADEVVVAYGGGGESDIDSLTASGHVRIKMPTQEATGDRATFDPDTQIVRLSDNVSVVSAQGRMSGPELTINLATNSTSFKGGKGGRVTGVFTPQ